MFLQSKPRSALYLGIVMIRNPFDDFRQIAVECFADKVEVFKVNPFA